MSSLLNIIIFITFFSSWIVVGKDKYSLPQTVPFDTTNTNANATQKISATNHNNSFIVRISGQISATSKSSLAFRVPGFIENINKKAGDKIKKGDVIAVLDPVDYELQVQLMKLNKEQALLAQKTAKNEFDRETQLKMGNASTASQYDLMETKYKQAHVALKLAEINLKTAERKLEFTKLRAPYDCVLAQQYKDKAEQVGMDAKIFDIYEANSVEINLNAPEILVGKINVGSKLSVFIPSINYNQEATVSKVVPAVSEVTRTFKVTAILKQDDPRVVPGLFAEAQLK
ncbi:MAG: efflux RND transporter periplasmic adaptor subunit [Myxococcales bacterium]|nr:efflux RND transporter periplasmic adaptor subunit [Myxococcales bacterium]USN51834.1 MAG: efflux RND transporter periplasmic adaptor subunit [Myxococcales bacterium]